MSVMVVLACQTEPLFHGATRSTSISINPYMILMELRSGEVAGHEIVANWCFCIQV